LRNTKPKLKDILQNIRILLLVAIRFREFSKPPRRRSHSHPFHSVLLAAAGAPSARKSARAQGWWRRGLHLQALFLPPAQFLPPKNSKACSAGVAPVPAAGASGRWGQIHYVPGRIWRPLSVPVLTDGHGMLRRARGFRSPDLGSGPPNAGSTASSLGRGEGRPDPTSTRHRRWRHTRSRILSVGGLGAGLAKGGVPCTGMMSGPACGSPGAHAGSAARARYARLQALLSCCAASARVASCRWWWHAVAGLESMVKAMPVLRADNDDGVWRHLPS